MSSKNPMEGITVITADDVGRHSALQRLAFRLQRRGIAPSEFAQVLGLSPAEQVALHYDRKASARPIQLRPPKFRRWLCAGGRGAGKTWAGANAVLDEMEADPGARILIIGPTLKGIREVMLEGPSGLLTLAPPWFRLEHKPSKNEIRAPNGARCIYSPAEAGARRLLGKAFSFCWADEVVAWTDGLSVYKEICKVLRHKTPRMAQLGETAKAVVSSTPEPSELFRFILEDREGLVVTRMTSFENSAHLDRGSVKLYRKLVHTSLGAQEHLGILDFSSLDTTPFARVDFWKDHLDDGHGPDRFDRIVIGYDPIQGGVSGVVDEAGIVVVGFRTEADGFLHSYILDDRSLKNANPRVPAEEVVKAYKFWLPFADKCHVLVETNKGGQTTAEMLKLIEPQIRVEQVLAREPKKARAETLAALWEVGLVHLVGAKAKFSKLVSQARDFTGADNRSDGRVDAAAWPLFRYAWTSSKNRGALAASEPVDAPPTS